MLVSSHLRDNYEDYYEGDSEWRRLGALDKTDNILTLCHSLPHRTVLEIGAGEGSILRRLSELKFAEELFALEISSSGVDAIIGKNIPELKQCLRFNGYDVPYEDKKFDLAILSHVIEHVEFPRRLLYEAGRVAKYVFVEVPLEHTIRLKQDFVFDPVGHIDSYTPKTIRRLLQTCNLTVLDQIVTNQSKPVYTYEKGRKGIVNFYVKSALLKIAPKLATAIFTYHSALVCMPAQVTGRKNDEATLDRTR